jgi:Tfp pilus assembly protein PilO
MITKFDTSGGSGSTSKSGNALIYILVAGVVAFLGYKYIIKPEMDKRKAEETK